METYFMVKFLNDKRNNYCFIGWVVSGSWGNRHRFFIFVGGGKICRSYQKALLEFKGDTTERDLIGIDVSRLNARVVKQAFDELAFSQVITNPTKKINTSK